MEEVIQIQTRISAVTAWALFVFLPRLIFAVFAILTHAALLYAVTGSRLASHLFIGVTVVTLFGLDTFVQHRRSRGPPGGGRPA